MSKPKKRRRALPLFLFLLAAAVLLAARTQAEKQQYIDARPDTPLMASLRAQSPNHSLDLDELVASPLPAEQDAGPILYNATFYPDARTVVCTVSVPGGGETAPYLVRYDRRPIPGRYDPGEDRYGVRRLYFEEVSVPRFGWLDLVDAGSLNGMEYNPYADPPPGRVRFLLDEEYAFPR
ncbi:hypothetical protein [Anaerotruncus massiliensis (ex Togo et al. 2019)]|uniref:hypothetical protein n=1 Tax=Anaerotruncus TaxID=244127 RepID=UPI000C774B80|nr:hypothetical protein [Anaerotruncus massiliensis (ex Togo et al. 2019)]